MRISTLGLHNASVARMLSQQSAVARTQEQIGSQRRFRTAGEDPSGMAQALSLESAQAARGRLVDNAGQLRHRLSAEEGALDSIDDTLNRLRELAVQANSGALSDGDSAQIAGEMQQQYARLVDLANSDDGTGHHLFGGTRDGEAPFARTGTSVVYLGDQDSRSLAVGRGAQMREGDSGDAVFLRIAGGVSAVANSSNTGTLAVTSLSATGTTEALQLSFGGGRYEARRASDGTLVQDGAYRAGDALQLPGGLRLQFSGTPADGDRIDLAPAGNRDLFARAQELITAAGIVGSGDAAQRAQNQTRYQQALAGIDGGLQHLNGIRASVGTRLATLDDVDSELSALDVQLQSTLSEVRDLDYAEAISRLQLQSTGLQAAQAVFAKVQGLSLFNYLR